MQAQDERDVLFLFPERRSGTQRRAEGIETGRKEFEFSAALCILCGEALQSELIAHITLAIALATASKLRLFNAAMQMRPESKP